MPHNGIIRTEGMSILWTLDKVATFFLKELCDQRYLHRNQKCTWLPRRLHTAARMGPPPRVTFMCDLYYGKLSSHWCYVLFLALTLGIRWYQDVTCLQLSPPVGHWWLQQVQISGVALFGLVGCRCVRVCACLVTQGRV